MNRLKDTFLIMLLPLTLTAAIALTMCAVIAFRMEANTEGVKEQLPQTLKSEDTMFLMLLLQEGGFLDNELKPAIRKEDGEINQTLYAYIADAVCTALNIRQGKWKIFEKLWPINNGTQTISRYKQETKDASTQYQKQIARLLRKATRIRPGLDTYDLQYFKGH